MKKKLLIFIISLLIILVVVQPTILTELWWKIKYSVGGYFIDKKYEVREEKAREKNREAAEKWVVSKYGEAVAKVVEIEYDGKSEGWVDWSTFKMTAPFAVGWIVVNSEDQSIVSGGFDLEGKKFQHLYSEWIKKQVGIDDENVELEFDRAMASSARVIGSPIYIDFKEIVSCDNLEDAICKNTHNIYIRSNTYGDPGAVIKMSKNTDLQEMLNYADDIEEKIRPKVFINNSDNRMSREENKLFIQIKDNDKKMILSILYNYDENFKAYNLDNDWVKYG